MYTIKYDNPPKFDSHPACLCLWTSLQVLTGISLGSVVTSPVYAATNWVGQGCLPLWTLLQGNFPINNLSRQELPHIHRYQYFPIMDTFSQVFPSYVSGHRKVPQPQRGWTEDFSCRLLPQVEVRHCPANKLVATTFFFTPPTGGTRTIEIVISGNKAGT